MYVVVKTAAARYGGAGGSVGSPDSAKAMPAFVCSFCMLLAQLVCTGAVSVMACTVLKRCGGTDTWERWYVCTSLTVVDSECLKINSS